MHQNCLRRPSRTASTAWTWPLNQQGHLRSEISCTLQLHTADCPVKTRNDPKDSTGLQSPNLNAAQTQGRTRHMKAQRDNAKHLQPHAVERQLAPSDVSQWGSEDTKQANSRICCDFVLWPSSRKKLGFTISPLQVHACVSLRGKPFPGLRWTMAKKPEGPKQETFEKYFNSAINQGKWLIRASEEAKNKTCPAGTNLCTYPVSWHILTIPHGHGFSQLW